jgi:hypothetical protein
MQSQLCGKYATVRLYYMDGDSDVICQITGITGNQYDVITRHGSHRTVDITQIKNLINVTQYPKYSVGQRVYASIHINQFDGYENRICEIISVTQFCNDINYNVSDLKNKQTHFISQNNIYRLANIEPIYQIDNYVGVQYDTFIKNGRILSIKKENDNYKYVIKYDDGDIREIDERCLTKAIHKTQEEIDRDYQMFRISEEQRLLEQLART